MSGWQRATEPVAPSPESWTIRPASLSDVPALAALIDASVRGLGPPYYDERQVESSLQFLFGVDTTMVADGTYLLAEAGGLPAACGGWSRRWTDAGGDQAVDLRDADLRDPKKHPAVLRAFFVHPDHARRGHGSRLVTRSEEAAQAAGYSSFELVATLPGVPLYRALGYEELGPFDIPLPDGVVIPTLRMIKHAR